MILGVMGALPGFFLDWLAVQRNWERAKYITKPLAMLVLMAWFAGANFFRPQTGETWQILILFFIGQVFSLAGDIFLLFPGRWFLWGLFAFLAAHICYIASLHAWLAPLQPLYLTAIFGVTAAAVIYFSFLYRHMAAAQRVRRLVFCTSVYVAAVSLMLISTISAFFRDGWNPVYAGVLSTGGLCFFASDGLLSYNKFVKPLAHGRLVVRVLYHFGQLTMALGLTLQLWVAAW
jgi:uncharacterized membrane protein YhhN